jgi:hypothetical protein
MTQLSAQASPKRIVEFEGRRLEFSCNGRGNTQRSFATARGPRSRIPHFFAFEACSTGAMIPEIAFYRSP